jgi:hypothetical protein
MDLVEKYRRFLNVPRADVSGEYVLVRRGSKRAGDARLSPQAESEWPLRSEAFRAALEELGIALSRHAFRHHVRRKFCSHDDACKISVEGDVVD